MRQLIMMIPLRGGEGPTLSYSAASAEPPSGDRRRPVGRLAGPGAEWPIWAAKSVHSLGRLLNHRRPAHKCSWPELTQLLGQFKFK